MAYGMRENIGARFRRVSRQVFAIEQAEDAERAAFFEASVEKLTDEELDALIADGENRGDDFKRMGRLLDAQYAQYQKEKKERKENGEPEKPLGPPCPPVRLF